MDRAFHSLTIRTVDEGQRIIEGWATTGRTDRVGDIVDPLGAEFDLPLPLLLDHDHSLAVGEVEKAEVTSQGIRFLARIKKIEEPGRAKELVDMAWHYARHGLRKCVSIGFQPLNYDPLPGGGLRFSRWSWYELSLCAVPANPDAVIETVKRAPTRAIPLGDARVVRLADPVGSSHLPVVRLSAAEKRRGEIIASAEYRHSIRRKAGLALPVVRLTGADFVEAELAQARAARKKRLGGARK